MKTFPRAALLGLLLLSACNKPEAQTDTKTDTAQTETKTDAATDTAQKDAAQSETTAPGPVPSGYTLVPDLTEKPVREFKAEPAMSLQDGQDYYALIDTNRGQVLVDLYEQETPVTVNNFVTLARNHFYDGLRFHRVIDGFMAQTGDPTGTGMGGSKLPDLKAEFTPTPFKRGTLGMARSSSPNSANSQFFICLADAPFLNNQYTVFGQVTGGMDVVDKIKKGASDDNGKVANPDKIVTMRMAESK